jgi:hypothetical protein
MDYCCDNISEELENSIEYTIEDNSFYYPAGEGIHNHESYVMVLATEMISIIITSGEGEYIPTMVDGLLSDENDMYSLRWVAELYKVETIDGGLRLQVTYYIDDVT